MAGPAYPGILALLRALGIGAEAAPSVAGAATGLTKAQQLARAATAERQAGRLATQQRMEAMANRGAGTSASAPAGAPNLMSPTGATLAAGAAIPMVDSPLSFLPKRAEGDIAGAINRRNAPVDYGMSDAAYREADRPQVGDRESYGLSDDAYRQIFDLARSAGKSDAEYRAERPQRPAFTASAAPAAPAAAAAEPSLRDRLFGGQDFQSNNQAVVSRTQGAMPGTGSQQRATLNFGDSGSAADFFRADKAMQGLLRDKEEFVGMASGGAANGSSNKAAGSGRDAAIYKALEIIHHMMVNRR